ncbi:unnamed protein product [Lota lota]
MEAAASVPAAPTADQAAVVQEAAAVPAVVPVPAFAGEAQHPGYASTAVDPGPLRVHQGYLSGLRRPKMQRFPEDEDSEHYLTAFEHNASASQRQTAE